MMNFSIQTKGHYDFVDITAKVQETVENQEVESGAVLVFVAGSTAAITTIEYEEGVIKDLIDVLEKIAPEGHDYKHHQKWGDKNGGAHIKSAIIGADLLVPFENKKLQLGTWQQIVLIDFDEKPRTREVIIKILEQT